MCDSQNTAPADANLAPDLVKEPVAPVEKRERDHSLDLAKGLLICLVVWGHMGFHSRAVVGKSIALVDYYAGIDFPDWLYQSFYMCAFFIISGIFDRTVSVKKLYKSSKALLVPVFTLFIPFTILSAYLRDSSQSFIDIVSKIGIPWFIVALFWMKCFSYGFNKVKMRGLYLIIAALILHFIGLILIKNGVSFLALEYGLVFFIFYVSGRYMEKLNKVPGLVWTVLFIASTVLSHMLFQNLPNLQGGFSEDYWQVPLSILIGLSGSMAFIKLMRKINRNKLFEYIGERTLIIYFLSSCFQLVFIQYLGDAFKSWHAYNVYLAGVIWIFINFVVPIVACILIQNFFSKEGRKWVLGKW